MIKVRFLNHPDCLKRHVDLLQKNLVARTNAFYVNNNNNYVEVFAGLESILTFSCGRDCILSYGNKGQVAIRIGLGGLLGDKIRFR